MNSLYRVEEFRRPVDQGADPDYRRGEGDSLGFGERGGDDGRLGGICGRAAEPAHTSNPRVAVARGMAELNFDRPVPALTDEEDLETLAAIDEATAQIEAGEGIPLEELRKEFERRCSK
jgi:hypothetical protein